MSENGYKNWQEKTLIPYIKKTPQEKKGLKQALILM